MGPTIHIMGLMRSKDEGVELFFFRTLNPFSCNNYIVASCDDNYNLNLVEIMDEIIGCRFFDDLKLFTTMPTFIVPVNQNMVAIVNNLIESIYFSVEEDLSILNKMFEETLGNPWDLASLQLKRGLSNIKNKPQTTPFKSNVEDLEKYIELVLNPKNISAHIKSIHLAWEGAIKNNIIPPVLKFETLFDQMNYSGCGIFNLENIENNS